MKSKHTPFLWALSLILFIALLFARVVKPEWPWLLGVLGLLLLATLGQIVFVNRADIQRDKAIRGASSITTVILVIAILGVVNFLAGRYPKKIDLTKNHVNTLSDQSVKAVRNVKEPLHFTLFAKPEATDEFRPLFENYRATAPKLEVEYVNPMKEAIRAQKAGLRSDSPTLELTLGTRTQLIDSPTEEKVTNALLKLTKSQSPVLCNITQHGERDFESSEANGYSQAKAVLEKQSYLVKPVNLIAETKIPADCSAIAILGPSKAFFPQEMKLIEAYLDGGGKAVIALDFSVKGASPEASPELVKILGDWGVNAERALIIDPISRRFELDPTMPLIATYAKDQAITKEMQGNSVFPFTRPLTVLRDQGPNLKLTWLAQTTPNSWGETDLKGLVSGTAEFGKGDFRGPLTVAIAIDGLRRGLAKTATSKDARIIAFGTSAIAANQFGRFGNNLDLFANAVSWMLDDESMISIRKNDEAGGMIQLSEQAAGLTFLVSVFLIPFLLVVCGLAIWWYRKKL